MHSKYPGKQVSDLQGSDTQIISALSTLAAGLAGGVTGGSSASALAGAQAGRNAVENNSLSLPKGLNDIGLSQQSLAANMIQNGASPDELTAALVKNSLGQIPEGQDAVKGLLTGWAEFFGVPVSALASDGEMTPQRAAEILASGVPKSEAKLVQYVAAKAFLSIAKSSDLGLAPSNQKYVDILSPEAKQHILYGIALRKGDIYILEIQ
ncbi:VENN motif pre-toxin domain-containing protein [Pantoea dispersa]|uniref:VENN motif pre-toxin domain-containing protein n=1 Tax=Pantoea dispersa TaxID=59814 RepID=UPI002222FF01|nr:VENN motif pre-toxin domain-containing protein [Pantoea dispersa]UYV59464.1 VENN motif pre-toxin domain-containing protein [Pantoea dispersa]